MRPVWLGCGWIPSATDGRVLGANKPRVVAGSDDHAVLDSKEARRRRTVVAIGERESSLLSWGGGKSKESGLATSRSWAKRWTLGDVCSVRRNRICVIQRRLCSHTFSSIGCFQPVKTIMLASQVGSEFPLPSGVECPINQLLGQAKTTASSVQKCQGQDDTGTTTPARLLAC